MESGEECKGSKRRDTGKGSVCTCWRNGKGSRGSTRVHKVKGIGERPAPWQSEIRRAQKSTPNERLKRGRAAQVSARGFGAVARSSAAAGLLAVPTRATALHRPEETNTLVLKDTPQLPGTSARKHRRDAPPSGCSSARRLTTLG